MCRVWEQTGVCPREGCKFAHDWSGYFATKPQDIHYEAAAEIRGEPPYVSQKGRIAGGEDELGRTVDGGTDCPVFRDMGYCSYGWRCRFLGGHVRRVPDVSIMNRGGGDRIGEWDLLARKEDASGKEGAVREWKHRETNWPDHEVTSQLRNNSVCAPLVRRAQLTLGPVRISLLREIPAPYRAAQTVQLDSEQEDFEANQRDHVRGGCVERRGGHDERPHERDEWSH